MRPCSGRFLTFPPNTMVWGIISDCNSLSNLISTFANTLLCVISVQLTIKWRAAQFTRQEAPCRQRRSPPWGHLPSSRVCRAPTRCQALIDLRSAWPWSAPGAALASDSAWCPCYPCWRQPHGPCPCSIPLRAGSSCRPCQSDALAWKSHHNK